jgi:hypothetical protein
MNTMALVDETVPIVMHSRILSVVSPFRPQSSALMIRVLATSLFISMVTDFDGWFVKRLSSIWEGAIPCKSIG